ncbi:23760_t:CDS:2, partial [Dentiscutata erythropus]
RGLTDMSIYSQDVLLSDPCHTGLYVRGKHVYLGIANLLRWSLIWYFDDLTLEIVKIHVADNSMEDKNDTGSDILFKDISNDTHFKESSYKLQHKDRDKNLNSIHTIPLLSFSTSTIQSYDRNIRLYVRWELEGTPRSSYIASMLSSRSTRIPRSSFSGIFVYKFCSKNGLVAEHHVKHIVPAPSRRAVLYQGFGGLGGLMWRLRSGLRQKNEWGVGLGIVDVKIPINVKSSKDKNENHNLGLENSDQTLQEREEDLEDGGDLDTEELLAAMAENSSDQFSEVPPEEIEDEELLLDDTLSPLEKIFLYVKSDLVFHRVFIAKELPSLIKDVEISEAVEYVLPLMNSLGTDPEDHVREAFAPELDKIIWFYYSHCPLREITTEITADNIQNDNTST